MHLVRRSCALLSTAALTAALLAAAPSAATAAAAHEPGPADTSRVAKAQMLLHWERIAFRTDLDLESGDFRVTRSRDASWQGSTHLQPRLT